MRIGLRVHRSVGQGGHYLVSTALLFGLSVAVGNAATFPVTTFTDTASGGAAGTGTGAAGDLRAQILAANASPGADVINFSCGAPPCTITLTGPLPPITETLTIDGGTQGSIIIDGASAYRVFFVDTGAVALQNLVIRNGRGQGGTGGTGDGGGGGGAGLGGGLFVNQASAAVSLTNVRFQSCSAIGGAGGAYASQAYPGGGGGGMVFRGGNSTGNTGAPGGGGMLAQGVDLSSGQNGSDGGAGGGGGGGRLGAGTPGNGSAAYATNLGGLAGATVNGGAGGFGGGGGGAPIGAGGAGGFGGGGGGTGSSTVAGNGGPGGGGGGSDGGTRGTAGSLGSGVTGGNGGTGTGGGGGGGAAAGPAVFVNAGTLTITNSYATGSSATAGAGGTGLSGHSGSAGAASGVSLFNYAGLLNSSAVTGPSTLLDLPAPTVTSISPASGPASGGTSVTITGTGFTGATSVTIGGSAATFSVVNDTTITATTPGETAGASASVIVTTPDGSNAANSLFQYQAAVPTLSEWGMGALAAMLAFYALWRMRRRDAEGVI